MPEPLAFETIIDAPYAEALERVIAALKAEGFGVITRIDVQATIREKLGLEFRPYAILGACNPRLAHRALESDPQVGLLLPCNVTVDERADGVHVAVGNPEVLLGGVPLDSPALREVAAAARARLERVAHSLR
jgi:uncharacterized protein (DUF302 family)